MYAIEVLDPMTDTWRRASDRRYATLADAVAVCGRMLTRYGADARAVLA